MKVIACIGLGLCLVRHHLYPEGLQAIRRRGKVTARFDGASPVWGISDLKSNAVGESDVEMTSISVRMGKAVPGDAGNISFANVWK